MPPTSRGPACARRSGPEPGRSAGPRPGSGAAREAADCGQVRPERGHGRVHAGLLTQVRRRGDQAGAVRQGGVHQGSRGRNSRQAVDERQAARGTAAATFPCFSPTLAQKLPDLGIRLRPGVEFTVSARIGRKLLPSRPKNDPLERPHAASRGVTPTLYCVCHHVVEAAAKGSNTDPPLLPA